MILSGITAEAFTLDVLHPLLPQQPRLPQAHASNSSLHHGIGDATVPVDVLVVHLIRTLSSTDAPCECLAFQCVPFGVQGAIRQGHRQGGHGSIQAGCTDNPGESI